MCDHEGQEAAHPAEMAHPSNLPGRHPLPGRATRVTSGLCDWQLRRRGAPPRRQKSDPTGQAAAASGCHRLKGRKLGSGMAPSIDPNDARPLLHQQADARLCSSRKQHRSRLWPLSFRDTVRLEAGIIRLRRLAGRERCRWRRARQMRDEGREDRPHGLRGRPRRAPEERGHELVAMPREDPRQGLRRRPHRSQGVHIRELAPAPGPEEGRCPGRCQGGRYETTPGEAHQMDWEFVDAENPAGGTRRMVRFAMVCHH